MKQKDFFLVLLTIQKLQKMSCKLPKTVKHHYLKLGMNK